MQRQHLQLAEVDRSKLLPLVVVLALWVHDKIVARVGIGLHCTVHEHLVTPEVEEQFEVLRWINGVYAIPVLLNPEVPAALLERRLVPRYVTSEGPP